MEPYKIIKHTLPSATAPFVFGSKSVSYAYLNTVRTWFWRNDVTTMRCFLLSHDESFTAIAQLPDGTLVMGTSMGRLYVDREIRWINVLQGQEEQMVSELLVLGRDHLILKTEGDRKFLVDLLNRNIVKEFGSGTEVCRFSDNKFASVCGRTCEVRHVSDDYSLSLTVTEECSDIRAEQEKFVLLRHGSWNQFTIWLVEEQTHMLAPLQTYNYTNQFRRLIFISAQEFFVPNFAGNSQVRCEHYVYQVETNKWNLEKESKPAGKKRVTSMERIGASIVYVTEPQNEQGPVLYAFDMECKLIWCGLLVRSGDWDSGSSNLVVLNSGLFAVRLSRSIYLFTPNNQRKCRSRLFVGEGSFHYTEALINKHNNKYPFIAKAITATDVHSREWHFVDTRERMDMLQKRGVTVELEIDAQQIHEHYRNKRFKRIHWNCPFGENPFNYDFRKFFQSSRQIQKCGDRVYITLMQEKTQYGTTFRQKRQKANPIASGSHLAGYRLIKKRAFGKKRYPGYMRLSTSGHKKLISDDAEMREFVFEKISFDKQCVLTKKHDIIQDRDGFFLECDTDNDSSTYEDSSDDETGSNS